MPVYIGARRALASKPVGQTFGVLAANRFQYQTAAVAIAAQPATFMRTHWAHPDGDISALKTVDINRYLSSSSAGAAGAAHDMKRYIEYPAGVFWQVTWGGLGTVNLASGATLVSDVIAGLVIPAGAQFWERTVYLTTGTFPCMELPATPININVDDGSVSADSGNSGVISRGGSINVRGCQAILGTVNAPGARAFFGIGDSIMLGTGDITSVGIKGGSGYPARVLDQHGWPYFKFCKGGQQAAEQVGISATINSVAALFGFTDVLMQSGLNDLSLGSRTKAQIEGDYQTLFALSNIAGKRIYKTTITPRSSSTDGWITTDNQTPTVDGNMADLTGLNTDIRAGLPNVNIVLEAADAAMSARNSNIHKAPPAGSADGTHMNSTRVALIAAALSL